MLKRLLSLILALTLVFGGIMTAWADETAPVMPFDMTDDDPEEDPAAAFLLEDDTDPEEDLEMTSDAPILKSGKDGAITWTIYEDGLMTIAGTGPMTEYDINTMPPWYNYCDKVTKVTFGSGITSIGAFTCYHFTNLTAVTFASTVKRLGTDAFAECESLKEIKIPSGVQVISWGCFSDCKTLEKVTIPSSVIEIESYAFKNCCRLASVTLPAGMKFIDSRAFVYCSNLSQINFPAGLTSIGEFAFYVCDLRSVVLPSSVKTVGKCAFGHNSKMTNIELSSGMTEIADQLLCQNPSLTKVYIPENVRKIGMNILTDGADEVVIYFLGNAPTFDLAAFCNTTVRCYVSAWSNFGSAQYQNYGGTATWYKVATTTKLVALRGDTTNNLAWLPVEGADGYQVLRSTTPNGTYSSIKSVTGTSTGTALPPAGTTYYYRIRPYKMVNGEKVLGASSAYVQPKECTINVTFARTVGSTGYFLWNTDSSIELSGYSLLRATAANGTYSSLKSFNTPFCNTTAPTGTAYYKIRPYILFNGTRVKGASSTAVTLKPFTAPGTVGAVKSGSTVNLAWSKVSGATGYSLSRSTTKGGTYSGVKSVTDNYTGSYMPAAGTYYYKVRAYFLYNGERVYSAYSAAFGIKDLGQATIVSAVSNNTGSATIISSKPAGATGYGIYRSSSKNGTYSIVRNSTISSETLTGLGSGVTCWFKLKPYLTVAGVKLYGEFSTPVSVKLK